MSWKSLDICLEESIGWVCNERGWGWPPEKKTPTTTNTEHVIGGWTPGSNVCGALVTTAVTLFHEGSLSYYTPCFAPRLIVEMDEQRTGTCFFLVPKNQEAEDIVHHPLNRFQHPENPFLWSLLLEIRFSG